MNCNTVFNLHEKYREPVLLFPIYSFRTWKEMEGKHDELNNSECFLETENIDLTGRSVHTIYF